MNKTRLLGLATALLLSLIVLTAESQQLPSELGDIKQISENMSVKEGASKKESEAAAMKAVRESIDSRSRNVLTRDDIDKASAYQGLVRVVASSLDNVEDSLALLRRQTSTPSRNQLDEIQSKLDIAEKALDELSMQATHSVDRIQEEEQRDRLFTQRLSLEILRRRLGIGGNVLPFGMDFFQGASGQSGAEASAVPASYTLRIKDKLMILATSKLGAQTEYHQSISGDGMITVAGIGKIRAEGINIAQLNKLANKRMSAKFKQMKLDITLESISSVSVQVAGSVVKPGTYTLSGLSTVMTALYKSGGPNSAGTMRNIYLSRSGAPRKQIDLYKFFVEGNKDQDVVLRDGDLIFVPPVGKTVTIDGEVIRPARYEPTFPITLTEAIKLAGGAKASGYLQQISVERIVNGEYRILMNTPVNDKSATKFALQPGDQISISSVRPERTNIVTISGPVNSPGTFELRPGMHVSDLISMAQGIDPNREVYPGRADILRLNVMKGTELISFDLGKALQKDPGQDIELQKLDRVFLYLPEQVAFRNNRIRISGAVSNPGVYDRKDGMKISDAIAASGGVLPEAFLPRADLVRYQQDGSQELIKVNLETALAKNVADDVVMSDRDELMIYTMEEAGWKDSRVRIEGSVQRPGTYKRVENMRLSDLLFAAGGLLPESDQSAELGRIGVTGRTIVTKINIADLKNKNESDVLLNDRDIVTIPSVNSVVRVPEIVYLSGEVMNPGPYTLSSKSEKLCDIIQRAGGLSQRADQNGLILMRKKDSFDNEQQRKDVHTVLKNILLFADKQFLTQLSQMGIRLPDGFFNKTQTSVGELSKPLGASDIRAQDDGIVREENDGETAMNAASVLKTKDSGQSGDPDFGKSETEDLGANLNKPSSTTRIGSKVETNEEAALRLANHQAGPPRAMGEKLATLSQNEPSGLAATANAEDILELARISVDFRQAMNKPSSPDNIALRAGDRIHIPRLTDTVTVLGAVLHPHVFAAGSDKKVDFYIERSGGYAQDAIKSSTIVVHSNGDAVPANKVKFVVPGDIVVVPTTGLIDIARKWEKIGSVTTVISDILSSVYVLTRF